uniref:Putative sulfotransferase n=1 Tax=Amblyomma triste TaxID=251400 RepID=A0A023GKL4_AMBTT
MNAEAYKRISGVPVLALLPDENVRSAMQYKPKPSDVIIDTYPKCGTTWTQYIVSNILTKAKTPVGPAEYMLFSPYLELMGAEAAQNPTRKGPLMTHLPMKSMVFSEEAKYIYAARNPYDCCVSCYHFLRCAPLKCNRDMPFGKFLENFISGEINYGDFFDHLLPWYEVKDKPNVLFVTFEEMKRDSKEWILKIADFLGEEHGTALRKDSALLAKILELSSLEVMRAVFNYTTDDRVKALARLPPERTCSSIQALSNYVDTENGHHEGPVLTRKGIVGDWKTHFTPQEVTMMKAWIDRKTVGTDVMSLWKGCGLP